MKKSNSINKLLLLSSIAFFSCQDVFIPDPIDPRLPQYTENGQGTGGALIDGIKWESINEPNIFYSFNPVSIVIIPDKKSISIKFTGNVKGDPTDIVVNLNQMGCKTEKDILSLVEKKFALNNGTNSANIERGNDSYNPSNTPGQIYFRSIKSTNGEYYDVSGTFGFSVISSKGKLIEVTYGRFDFKLCKGEELLVR